MNSDSLKLHSCTAYEMQPCNSASQTSNPSSNPVATMSLKALAQQYLENNRRCNSSATEVKNGCNFTTPNLANSFIPKHGISLLTLKEFLNEDWDDYKDNPEALEFWTDLLFKSQLMKQGIVPNNFTATTHCSRCGYVYVPPALLIMAAH